MTGKTSSFAVDESRRVFSANKSKVLEKYFILSLHNRSCWKRKNARGAWTGPSDDKRDDFRLL